MPLVSMAALVAGARAGKVVSFPTDTVPALAAIASRSAKIFALKQRAKDKPLILMAATLDELLPYVDTDCAALAIWQQVARAKWPGALTLILPATKLGQDLNPGSKTIGLRIPDRASAIAILQQTGPLLTTSANQSGEPPMRKMGEIAAYFPQVLVASDVAPALVTGSGLPSTVLEWVDSGWQVRRQGQVSIENLLS